MLIQALLSASMLWTPTGPPNHRAPLTLGVRQEWGLSGSLRAQGGAMLEWGTALPPLVRVARDGDASLHWGLGLLYGRRARLLATWTRTDRLVAGSSPGYYVSLAAGAELPHRLRVERLAWTPKRWLADTKRTVIRGALGPVRAVAVESGEGRWGGYLEARVHGPLTVHAGRELITRGTHTLVPAWLVGAGFTWGNR